MISFIVPGHNEEACLGRALQAIHESVRAAGEPYEIIVVDDASTDATAEIARQNNAMMDCTRGVIWIWSRLGRWVVIFKSSPAPAQSASTTSLFQ